MKRARTAKRSAIPAASAAGSGELATVVVPVAAPRNPFVAHALKRKGGAHGGGARRRRQEEKRELKKLLED